MNDPVNAMGDDCLLKAFEVQNICEDVRSLLNDLLVGLDDVRKNHIFLAILRSQKLCASSAQLSQPTLNVTNEKKTDGQGCFHYQQTRKKNLASFQLSAIRWTNNFLIKTFLRKHIRSERSYESEKESSLSSLDSTDAQSREISGKNHSATLFRFLHVPRF